MNGEYLTDGQSYAHLCDLCHGSSFRFCRRDHSEDYFGNTGAFRCLVEGGGHVAFVRHATVLENTVTPVGLALVGLGKARLG